MPSILSPRPLSAPFTMYQTPGKLCVWTGCHSSTGSISGLLPLADIKDGNKKHPQEDHLSVAVKWLFLIQLYKALSIKLTWRVQWQGTTWQRLSKNDNTLSW